MAGVYIPSMEMPTRCADCLFVDYFKGQWYCHSINDILETGTGKRDERCNLIPVPSHGRLVDADALEQKIEDSVVAYWNGSDGYYLAEDARYEVHYATTIIPASKEDE